MYISVTQHNYLTILAFFFIYSQEKSIALARYLTLLYSTNIKLSKKC